MTAPKNVTVTNLDASPLPPGDNPESLDGLPHPEDYARKLEEVAPLPLTISEQRKMFQMVHDTHTMLMDMLDTIDDLPAQLPKMLDGLPSTLKMMLGIR